MSLDTIFGIWIGPRLSTMERLSICSFLHHGHPFELFTYGPVENVPKAVRLRDASKILPETAIWRGKSGSVAEFVDHMRWKILAEEGGFYVDLDTICIKPFDFTEDVIFGSQYPGSYANGLLKFPKAHPLPMHMLTRCVSPLAFQPYDSKKRRIKKIIRRLPGLRNFGHQWGEVGGPGGFGRALAHFNLEELAKPFPYFYPVYGIHAPFMFAEGSDKLFPFYETTYSVHMWNETGKSWGLMKDAIYPDSSLYEFFKRIYLDANS